MRRHGGDAQVFRITGARAGLRDDVRGRQRRYVVSMSVRTVSVILAVSLWGVQRHIAIAALILGVVLPYVAVVIANAGRENAPSLPDTFVSDPGRATLPPVGADRGDTVSPPGGTASTEHDDGNRPKTSGGGAEPGARAGTAGDGRDGRREGPGRV
ncbi:DUF3099 domain-containing protein [Streptomyces sp. ZYX-F-203]